MTSPLIPKTYEDWRHCITVECGLKLTPDYISKRLSALQDSQDHYTQQFVKLYGDQYLQQVISWFAQSKNNL